MKLRDLFGALAVLTLALVQPLAAAAETAPEFYKDKVVKLVVGYGAGGGYDTYARLLAPHIAARLGADKGNTRYLYRLFPEGPAKQVCRYAGLPKPTSCI